MATNPPEARPDAAPLRLRRPTRDQVTPVPTHLDALLPDDHLARLLWAAVARLDLTAFAARLRVVEGGPGRAAAAPQLLVALWLFATTQGVTSARALARLCVELSWPANPSDVNSWQSRRNSAGMWPRMD